MADVNVTDLRHNLPSYLERARRGERIRVTSRGEVIAKISGRGCSLRRLQIHSL
jgi:prevent-host-death family protein